MTSTSKASILIFYLSLLTQSITLGFSTVSTRNLSFKHATSVTSKSSNTRLSMIFRGKDYDRVVEGIMVAKGLTREEAEADYNLYLENPNNYALNKVNKIKALTASLFLFANFSNVFCYNHVNEH